MADNFSFDIVSQVDLQEASNAVNQANKEISQRYDFKGSKSEITLNQKESELMLLAEDEMKLRAVTDILQSKLVKRSISLKAMTYGAVEDAAQAMVRQKVTIQSGIEKEKAKEIVKYIKETKMKVQAQIMDAQVRVTGRKKDDLQELMQVLKEKDFDIDMEFTNYR